MLEIKSPLAQSVLFRVMPKAQADAPAVGRLHAQASISATTDVRTLNGNAGAAADGAMMLSNPGAVACA